MGGFSPRDFLTVGNRRRARHDGALTFVDMKEMNTFFFPQCFGKPRVFMLDSLSEVAREAVRLNSHGTTIEQNYEAGSRVCLPVVVVAPFCWSR